MVDGTNITGEQAKQAFVEMVDEPSTEAVAQAAAELDAFNAKVIAGLGEFDAMEAERIAKEAEETKLIGIIAFLEVRVREWLHYDGDDDNKLPVSVVDMWQHGRTLNLLGPDKKHGYQIFAMAADFASYQLEKRGIVRAQRLGHAVYEWHHTSGNIGQIAQCRNCKRLMVRDSEENIYGELIEKRCTAIPQSEDDLPF